MSLLQKNRATGTRTVIDGPPPQPEGRPDRWSTRRWLGAAALVATAVATLVLSQSAAWAGIPDPGDSPDWRFPDITSIAANPVGTGSWVGVYSNDNGAVTAHDGAPDFGNVDVPDSYVRATPSGGGYYLIDEVGDIKAVGDAVSSWGSVSDQSNYVPQDGDGGVRNPISGFAVTPSGKGLWVIDSKGNVWTIGDAPYLGSAASSVGNAFAVDIVATHTGKGYIILGNDGGIFTYGDAQWHGRFDDNGNWDITAMAMTPDDGGYWVLDKTGHVYEFGDAPFLGFVGINLYDNWATDISPLPNAWGFYVVAEDGTVFPFVPTLCNSSYYQHLPLTSGRLKQTNGIIPLACDGPVSKINIVSPPTQGTLTDIDPTYPSVSYTPPEHPTAKSDKFSYSVTDPKGRVSTPVWVFIDLTQDNTAHHAPGTSPSHPSKPQSPSGHQAGLNHAGPHHVGPHHAGPHSVGPHSSSRPHVSARPSQPGVPSRTGRAIGDNGPIIGLTHSAGAASTGAGSALESLALVAGLLTLGAGTLLLVLRHRAAQRPRS